MDERICLQDEERELKKRLKRKISQKLGGKLVEILFLDSKKEKKKKTGQIIFLSPWETISISNEEIETFSFEDRDPNFDKMVYSIRELHTGKRIYDNAIVDLFEYGVFPIGPSEKEGIYYLDF